MPHRPRRQNPASRKAPHVETGPAPVKGPLRREKRTTRETVTNCCPGGGPSRANLLDIRVLWTLTSPSSWKRDGPARQEARHPLRKPGSAIRKPSTHSLEEGCDLGEGKRVRLLTPHVRTARLAESVFSRGL